MKKNAKSVRRPPRKTSPKKKKTAESPEKPGSENGKDSVQESLTIPQNLLFFLKRAVDSERYLVAFFRVEKGMIHLDRTARHFPHRDLEKAIQMLTASLQQLKDADR